MTDATVNVQGTQAQANVGTLDEGFIQPKIIGYRQLTVEDAGIINVIKRNADMIEKLISEVRAVQNVDHRWISIATTDLQKGFMALVRAVARPSSF